MRGDKWLATTSVVRPPSRALALLCWPSAILVAAFDQVSGRPPIELLHVPGSPPVTDWPPPLSAEIVLMLVRLPVKSSFCPPQTLRLMFWDRIFASVGSDHLPGERRMRDDDGKGR